MTPNLLLAADSTVTQLRWRSMPELWLVVLVIVPLIAGFAWWVYRREADTAPRRWKPVLATLRTLAILAALFMLFEPYSETSVQKTVRANLVVLLDTSASLSFADQYADEELATKLAEAAGLERNRLDETPRIDLVRGVLGNETLGVVQALRRKFVLHLYTFDQELRPLWSESLETEGAEGEPTGDPKERIASIGADGRLSRIGDALDSVLEEFRLRDEPLAGVVLISDGRRHGGQVEPSDAARKAATLRTAAPVYTVVVGDPEEARNIHVANLRAKEAVLAKDQLTLEFTVRATGFDGRIVPVQLFEVVSEGNAEIPLGTSEVRLPPDGEEVQARIAHRFERAGSYRLRVGIPTQPGEKVTNDNFIEHPVTVIDRKLKVLYVEGYPRYEYRALMNALTRDTDTMETQVLLLSASPGYVQFTSPGVEPIDEFPHTRRLLMEYDVIILGDVDWKALASDLDSAKQDLENLRAFIEAGGGFAMISGESDAPRVYRGTPLQAPLPVLIDAEAESEVRHDPTRSTNMRLTTAGLRHPIMQLEDDPDRSRSLWEEDAFTAFFWYHPSPRAKELARVLAEHPRNSSRGKPHPILATMRYGRGRVFWSAIDELWRMRWVYEDFYYKRFWGEVIRYLATYRLQGGNQRFKIFTEDSYHVGDQVMIRASVLDPDFDPSRAETQTVTLRSPDGEEAEIVLRAVPDQPGNYNRVIRVTRKGTYLLTVEDPALEGQRPETTFRVIHATGETRDPLPDPQLMAQMADLSGGRTMNLSELGDLPEEIPSRTLRVPTDIRPDDVWDSMWALLLVVGLLTAEWLLRKRFRLL